MTFDHVLALDIAGNPYEWLLAKDAVTLYATSKVAWDLGSTTRVFRGGVSRSGVQSRIAIKPIVAVAGSQVMASMSHHTFALGDRDNQLLFGRDRYTCAYCAGIFHSRELTRDHIHPRSKGGPDSWMNCVTACKACNQAKADKWVHDFRPLIYVPYIPSRVEHYLLSGRNVLADQHEYLAAQLPKHSRLRH